jgi:hypothetical protein
MNYASLIDAERLAFARLATEAARRTGGRTVSNAEVIRCSGGLSLICADIGGETVTHGLELPPGAWTPALEVELVRLFRGSAEIALRQIGGIAA